jgi:hypothetical protein
VRIILQENLGRTNRLLSLIDTGHIENYASNSCIVAWLFAAAVTFLPSLCLATIWRIFTEPLPSNDRGIFSKPLHRNDKGIFTEPLPSKDKGISKPLHRDDKGIFTEPLPSNDKGNFYRNVS